MKSDLYICCPFLFPFLWKWVVSFCFYYRAFSREYLPLTLLLLSFTFSTNFTFFGVKQTPKSLCAVGMSVFVCVSAHQNDMLDWATVFNVIIQLAVLKGLGGLTVESRQKNTNWIEMFRPVLLSRKPARSAAYSHILNSFKF